MSDNNQHLCKHCGHLMQPAPVALFIEGQRAPEGCLWVCPDSPSDILMDIPAGTFEAMGITPSRTDEDGNPQYRFIFSYEVEA